MNTVPQMKQEAAVRKYNHEWHWIDFNATADAAAEFEKFGYYMPNITKRPGNYWLMVDSRYDLMEVVAYINTYGKTP